MVVGQRDRDDNVRNLSDAMTDMLAFVEEVDVLNRIQIVETVVSEMLKEVEACATFIQEYVQKGFYGQSIKVDVFRGVEVFV
jgi:hypothetical protein